ncbi:MAG: peptidylprolyl isomerase [Nostocales cyanobacterium]|nr:MAG: peptidylprolyl isomerase [Nostocales cyanobacterium]TAF12499.1 MAG: peptidylprolyl isomerase [Nostocales cyanobacterium]
MRLKFSQFLVLLLMISGLVLGGCATEQVASDTSTTSTTTSEVTNTNSESTTQATTVSENKKEKIPGMKDLPQLAGKAIVEMKVKYKNTEEVQTITIEVDGDNAPITAGNFVDLVQKGFYNGLKFHRVVRDPQPFVVQGGDPLGNGTGGYVDPKIGTERRIPLEIKPKGEKEPVYGKTFGQGGINKQPQLQHKLGAVAMARSQMPDSASSQFYFALADLPFLDGDYAVFGYVTNGFEAVNKIQQGDTIESATVIQGAENLKAAQ